MAAEGTAGDYTCSVCLELFSEPKVLPCCHTFCLKCLEKTARSGQKKGEIACPQCRKSHVIPGGGLTGFLTDFIASHEIEVAALKSSTGVKALICGECEGTGPLESYCNDCQNYLCHDCGSQLHKRLKAYRGHTVVLIDDVDVATAHPCQVQYCATHKDEAVKLYCKTCTKLICCNCAIDDHRYHCYKYVSDARQEVDAEMESLMSNVSQKLDVFKHNFEEIKNIEVTATGHSDVLKADVNNFFDELVQSIEGRRTLLLSQVETQCQKDMKQIWADKDFHERYISQISSVFALVHKARKCTGDVEMILTSIQSIQQLTQLQKWNWDFLAFINTVSSTPKFIPGEKVVADALGGVDSSSNSSVAIKFSYLPRQASLGTSLQFNVHVTSPCTQELVNGRSGTPVDLQGDFRIPRNLRVIVYYGKSGKELDEAHVSIVKVQHVYIRKKKKNRLVAIPQESSGLYIAYARPSESTVTSTVTSLVEDNYNVTIKLVCGGEHTVTFTAGGSKIKHTLTVVGFPRHGVRVKKGPDWKLQQRYSMSPCVELSTNEDTVNDQGDKDPGSVLPESEKFNDGSDNETVFYDAQDEWWYGTGFGLGNCEGDSGDMVSVREQSGVYKYKWGQDGLYEVELVNVM